MNSQLWIVRRCLALLALLMVLHVDSIAWGGGGPENLAIVVNADSWASKTIANEYVHLRGVPSYNLVYLSDLPSFERMDVDSFREKILLPVMNSLYRRGVLDHIDCVAYFRGLAFSHRRAIGFSRYQIGKSSSTGRFDQWFDLPVPIGSRKAARVSAFGREPLYAFAVAGTADDSRL